MLAPTRFSEPLRKPPMPPPPVYPRYVRNTNMVTPAFLSNCIGRCIFVWLRYGQAFWMVPVALQGDWIVAFVWNGRAWDLREFFWRSIDSFF